MAFTELNWLVAVAVASETTLVGTFLATNHRTGFSYSLLSRDWEMFNIDINTGVLSFNTAKTIDDYITETNSSYYEVVVRVSQNASLFTSKIIRVSIFEDPNVIKEVESFSLVEFVVSDNKQTPNEIGKNTLYSVGDSEDIYYRSSAGTAFLVSKNTFLKVSDMNTEATIIDKDTV